MKFRIGIFAAVIGAVAVGSVEGAGSMAPTAQFQPLTEARQSNQSLRGPRSVLLAKAQIDRSGRKQVGKASFYADKYAGRKMSDGTIMDPRSNNAASITLPLGTTARVTNLETGRSAFVKIRDRGPYARGRIIDLSPATARKIGLGKRQGVAEVEVVPISF